MNIQNEMVFSESVKKALSHKELETPEGYFSSNDSNSPFKES